jgi:hypothetical protein
MIFIKENAINNYHKIVLELEEIIKDNEMIIEVDQASIDMKKKQKAKIEMDIEECKFIIKKAKYLILEGEKYFKMKEENVNDRVKVNNKYLLDVLNFLEKNTNGNYFK